MNIGTKSLRKIVCRVHKALNDPSAIGVNLKDIRKCNDVKAYLKLLYEYRGFYTVADRLYFKE